MEQKIDTKLLQTTDHSDLTEKQYYVIEINSMKNDK